MSEQNIETNATSETTTTDEAKNESATPLSTEALDKLVQSRADKMTAEYGKTIAALKKENEKLKNEGKSVEEIKSRELAERDKAITEKEQALLERENRLHAIKAIKEAGLDKGDSKSLELADLVIAGATSEEDIDKRVSAFKGLVDSFVAEQVSETFKAKGRNPGGSKAESTANESTDIATRIGKERAERDKKSNDVLSMYTKRR